VSSKENLAKLFCELMKISVDEAALCLITGAVPTYTLVIVKSRASQVECERQALASFRKNDEKISSKKVDEVRYKKLTYLTLMLVPRPSYVTPSEKNSNWFLGKT